MSALLHLPPCAAPTWVVGVVERRAGITKGNPPSGAPSMERAEVEGDVQQLPSSRRRARPVADEEW